MSIEIVSDPEIMGGQQCFAGTRIPVRIASEYVTSMGRDWILKNYPKLTDAHIDAALAFDWPAIQDAEPIIEDLTVECRCGEEAGMIGYVLDDPSPWSTPTRYQCRLCKRAYDVRVTITEVTP